MATTPFPLYCSNCGVQNRSDHAFCFACGHPLRKSVPLPLPDPTATGQVPSSTLLRQRYRILHTIGRGGMGAVYAAQDTQLGDRMVAIKEMSQGSLPAEEVAKAVEGFKREAHILARLQHPGLPSIHDHFEEHGRWYFVMSFIQGETLRDYLRRKGGRLPIDEALRIGIELCTVLDYLHSHQPQLIFRDLKPSNIMLTPRGQIYLIDFGIARHFKPGQTRDTANYFSAGYAPPEQYGQAQTTVRSDIYSLGATMHQLLSGHDPSSTPFRFPDPRAQDSSLPAPLVALLMQMLELDEKNRPASMAEVKYRFEQIIRSSQPVSSIYPTSQQSTIPAGPQPRMQAHPGVSAAPYPVSSISVTLQLFLETVRHRFAQLMSQAIQHLPPTLIQPVQRLLSSSFSSRPLRIFLWTCFIVVAFIIAATSGTPGSSIARYSSLAMSGVGLIFLASNLVVKMKLRVDVIGGVLLMLVADALFLALLTSPFVLSGDMIFFMSTLALILGAIFLCRYAKATIGAIWGGLLTIAGIGIMFSQHGSLFLRLWIGFANTILGIIIFLATYKKEEA